MKHYNFHWILIGNLEMIRAKLIIVTLLLFLCIALMDVWQTYLPYTALSICPQISQQNTVIGEQTGDSEGDSYQPRFGVFFASGNVAAHEGWVARAKQLIIMKAEKTNFGN